MKQIIQSITEAFSMQSWTYSVSKEAPIEENPYDISHYKEIRLEAVLIGDPALGLIEQMYVGYDWQDRKVFQYLANSVNVHFSYKV